MSNTKSTRPAAPTKHAPAPPAPVGDMEHFHKLAQSGALADMLFKIGGTRKK